MDNVGTFAGVIMHGAWGVDWRGHQVKNHIAAKSEA